MASFRGILNIMLLVLTSDFQSPLTELTRGTARPRLELSEKIYRYTASACLRGGSILSKAARVVDPESPASLQLSTMHCGLCSTLHGGLL